MDRQRAAEIFRTRLLELIGRNQESRSAFAARVGMDRSTLSQLLAGDNERLPRAETVIAIANAAQVSCDWLFGLTQDERIGAELVASGMEIESDAGSPMDERLRRWHMDAIGYKIRYVPTTLPDLLKTETVIRYESPAPVDGPPEAEVSVEQASDRLSYSRHPETEMEVCCAFQALELFARGEGIWRGLDGGARRAQIERMIQLTEELYPTFRWLLYDGLKNYSVPVTVFGSQRAVVYVGKLYFVFNMTEQIRVLAAHFDSLVKIASVQPTETADFLREQLKYAK